MKSSTRKFIWWATLPLQALLWLVGFALFMVVRVITRGLEVLGGQQASASASATTPKQLPVKAASLETWN